MLAHRLKNRREASDHPSTAAPAAGATVTLARQPILDRSGGRLAYELVLEDAGPSSRAALDVVCDAGLVELVGENPAYVPVSRELLLSARPLPAPTGRIVLELGADQVVDQELLCVLEELISEGFKIALSDFSMTPTSEHLTRLASIVKVDVREQSDLALENLVEQLRSGYPGLTLIAKNVETGSEWVRCTVLGFDAFQGYYFLQPSRTQHSHLPSRGFTSLSTIVELSATDDFDALNGIITRDPGLSLRLLRYANSAWVSLPRRVGSVQEGLTWLGAATVRRFAMMAALARVNDVPNELLTTALVRARMCQLLTGPADSAAGDSAFTIGLFSVADALADQPLELVIEQLPFREDIADALVHRSGRLGDLLSGVVAYQQGDFKTAGKLIPAGHDLAQIYREAISWADSSIAALE